MPANMCRKILCRQPLKRGRGWYLCFEHLEAKKAGDIDLCGECSFHYKEARYKKHCLKCDLFKKQKGRCVYCGKKFEYRELQIEHKIPVSRGGPIDDPKNIQLACSTCNKQKGTMTDEEYRG